MYNSVRKCALYAETIGILIFCGYCFLDHCPHDVKATFWDWARSMNKAWIWHNVQVFVLNCPRNIKSIYILRHWWEFPFFPSLMSFEPLQQKMSAAWGEETEEGTSSGLLNTKRDILCVNGKHIQTLHCIILFHVYYSSGFPTAFRYLDHTSIHLLCSAANVRVMMLIHYEWLCQSWALIALFLPLPLNLFCGKHVLYCLCNEPLITSAILFKSDSILNL